MSDRLFQPPATFMRLPYLTRFDEARAVVLGLPFDCGAHPARIGSRGGPAAIRQASLDLERGDEHSNIDAFKILNAGDAGDVPVVPGNIEKSLPLMERAVAAVAKAGAVPITLGGDGAIALAEMRALRSVHGDLVTVHIDSHTDTEDVVGYDNGNPFMRAAEEGIVDTAASFHIGMRGNASPPAILEIARARGYTVIPQRELLAKGIDAIFAQVRAKVGRRPVYLCWDMDFFDPSCAPGVCTPTPGGVTAREGLAILEATAGLNFAGISVNTVSPPHDPEGTTALLAANVVQNFMNLLARGIANE